VHPRPRRRTLPGSTVQGLSIPSRVKLPTGEPDAGDPPVRFGGRGRVLLSPYPYLSAGPTGTAGGRSVVPDACNAIVIASAPLFPSFSFFSFPGTAANAYDPR